MRIAVLHSFYRSDMPSGENVVVSAQVNALRAAGHRVRLFGIQTDQQQELLGYPLRAAWRVATGRGPDPSHALSQWQPDVVHVHNLFPNIATGWLADWPGRLIATLHNFRPLCAAGTLLRAGKPCTECPDLSVRKAVQHGCYHDSRLATVPVAWAGRKGMTHHPVLVRAERIVVPSPTAAEVFGQYGLPADRMRVVPNFVDPPPPDIPEDARRAGWVVVGRLDPVKGIADLLRRWPIDQSLDVIGTGPAAPELHELAGPTVRFLGSMSNEQVRRRLGRYVGLVFPGRAIEGGRPVVIPEAWSVGTPVVARSGGAGQHLVDDFGAGAVTSPDFADLGEVLNRVATNAELSTQARAAFHEAFTSQTWLRKIVPILAGED